MFNAKNFLNGSKNFFIACCFLQQNQKTVKEVLDMIWDAYKIELKQNQNNEEAFYTLYEGSRQSLFKVLSGIEYR
jgi:hypothetical protein